MMSAGQSREERRRQLSTRRTAPRSQRIARWGAPLLWVLSQAVLCGPSSPAAEPYKRMFDDRVRFTGPEGASADPSTLSEIRIGLFAPEDPNDPLAQSLIQGATLGIDRGNAEGGYEGSPFRLVRRWAENPWGAGSKEVVRLAYGDKVWAVIGSVGGDSTHIAEQILTKAFVPLLSPVSADPSLTQIRIPWIFRLPPSEQDQAAVLAKNGILPRSRKRLGLITSTDHDGRAGASALLQALEANGTPPSFQVAVPPQEENAEELASRISSFSPDGLVLRLPRAQVPAVLGALRKRNLSFPVFLLWAPGLEGRDLARLYGATVVTVDPFPPLAGRPAYASFVQAYRERFGVPPAATATYAYDAVCLVVKGIRASGLKRVALREALASLSGFEGASGPIRWDAGGGNVAQPAVIEYTPDGESHFLGTHPSE